MDTKKLGEILSLLNTYSNPSKTKSGESRLGVASDGSQPNPFQKEEGRTELPLDFSLDFHLTVGTQQTLTRTQTSLLLDILNYQASHFGINFGMWLAMEYLMTNLLGNKRNPIDIKDKKIRQTCFVSFIILSAVGNSDLLLEELKYLPEQILSKLNQNNLLMSKRTYGSRFSMYRPERLLKISAVPVVSHFDRIKGNSERYSSYCKGYGESHPSAHKKKTKPSFELDGESEEKDFIRLDEIPNLLILTQLEVWTKFHRKRKGKA